MSTTDLEIYCDKCQHKHIVDLSRFESSQELSCEKCSTTIYWLSCAACKTGSYSIHRDSPCPECGRYSYDGPLSPAAAVEVHKAKFHYRLITAAQLAVTTFLIFLSLAYIKKKLPALFENKALTAIVAIAACGLFAIRCVIASRKKDTT